MTTLLACTWMDLTGGVVEGQTRESTTVPGFVSVFKFLDGSPGGTIKSASTLERVSSMGDLCKPF